MSRQIRLSKAFGERYAILGKLGRGGAGMVLKARQTRLKRMVAVKIVDPDLFDDRVMMDRFAQEAQVTAEVQHPNVLTVIEAGVDSGPEGDVPYIVYELVEGSDLGSILEAEGGRLPPQRALSTMAEVLAGLEAAHSHDPEILHRDIKPDNILVAAEGQVKIADFGIAKRRGSGPRTQTGMVVGTPTYMSPEQAQGLPLTATSDIYSTGVMLYECLVGRPPFVAASGMEVAVMHVRDPAPPASGFDERIPAEMDALLARALEKDPGARFPDASSFRAALEDARRSWPLWVRRMETRPLARPHVSAGGGGRASAQTEEVRPPTRALEAPSRATVRGGGERVRRERWALAGTAVLLALTVAAGLQMSGVLSRGEAVAPGEAYAPLSGVDVEVGCQAATVRWESREAYPSAVRFRAVDGARGFRPPARPPEEPTRHHSVDLDGLVPGTAYQLHLMYPDGTKSLAHDFRTLRLEFLRPPRGRLEDQGVLHVDWKTNLPARAVVVARTAAGTQAAEQRQVDTRVYETEGVVTLEGFRPEDRVEFKMMLYTEWWDQQLARKLETRRGPELLLGFQTVRSLVEVGRERKERLTQVLEALVVERRKPWPVPGEPGYGEAVEGALARAAELSYDEAARDFEEVADEYLRSEKVDWVERRNWYRTVARFHDYVQGLDARGVANPFRVTPLYGPSLRPLGPRSGVGRLEAREVPLPFEDREDPDFEPVFPSAGPPAKVVLREEGLPAWPEVEVGARVRGLARGAVLELGLGEGVRVLLRGTQETAVSEGPVWLYHRVPGRALSPVPLYVTVAMYTAPGAVTADPVRVEQVVVRGRVR